MNEQKIKRTRAIIYILSAVIPLVVAVLFGVKIEGVDLSFLPPIYAGINGLTALLLIISYIMIRQKKVKIHEMLMKTCLGLSVAFLGCYVAYHMTSEPTLYKGGVPGVYYFILISHIALSILVIPMVLFSYMHAISGDFVTHKRWTRFAFPIWLYVAITGVVVYMMISPFYV